MIRNPPTQEASSYESDLMIERKLIHISGIVQSVGFRPFVYSLAVSNGLTGFVRNDETGVLLDVEGEAMAIGRVLELLKTGAPPLAQIDTIECRNHLPRAYYHDFTIEKTASNGRRFVPVSADVATCADCLRELFDPRNRRYRYPFINCTNCGPRFTIIEDVPYDRAKTTMQAFQMCADCRSEYENPGDRRFHAEPTACAECGPTVNLIRNEGTTATGDDPVAETIELLKQGRIVAIKGIGGFHLACDALNQQSVERLRARKFREEKPFGLMVKSVDVAREYCEISDEEAELLSSHAHPLVVLKRRAECKVPAAIAPRVNSLALMLAYSPLHHLLLNEFQQPLVMTSANVSDEPICYQDGDARTRLDGIADAYLMHNRPIHMRVDDSVARVRQHLPARARPMVIRRSRGYAPAPIKTSFKFKTQILACGAELKNTFCLTRDDCAFVSHHIGDLENLETFRSFTEGIEHFKRLFSLRPEVIAYDLHPEYLSTKFALGCYDIDEKIPVQHHHAHVASCMADNEITGDVIGVAMDGLGFGIDERMWGGEFFVADFAAAERIAHLEYMPMPGGVKAIQQPWRMAAAYLQDTFGEDFLKLDLPFIHEMDRQAWQTLHRMTRRGTNSPLTSSMGRLFDAVSSLLRLRDVANYEGQAAIELEQIADAGNSVSYGFELSSDGTIQARPVIRSVVEDLLQQVAVSTISARFHLAVAQLIVRVSRQIRDERKLNRVVLSGGVFQNMFLLNAACSGLSDAGFDVFTHRRLPTNDGGISLGQAAIANARLRR